jgi:predicted aspartyl protease
VTGRERGQATPLVAAVVVFAAIVAFALVRAGRVAVDSARARTAADAAALAGAADGRGAALRLAAANGGHLVRYRVLGADVVVEVDVGGVSARARARAAPGR